MNRTKDWASSSSNKKNKKLISKYSHGLSLDAGCGKGVYFDSFKGEVIGLDITLSFLREAKGQKSLILGDVRYLPFRERIFDFVLCSEVIEHIEEYEGKKAMRELERVAGGRIEVDTPNSGFWPELLRFLVFRKPYKRSLPTNPSPLLHHSSWTAKKSKLEGFDVRGCLGWVTRERIKIQFLCDLYDALVWYIPWLAGTIIGIKYVRTHVRYKEDSIIV